jgi:tartrate-resistant acid phosphatase type 5
MGEVASGVARVTRRQFLKQTIAFSALAVLHPAGLFAEAPEPDPAHPHLLLLGDWGTDRYLKQQAATAQSMQQWIERYHVKPQAMTLLGDNFYGRVPDGVNSKRWATQFESMYPAASFPGPAYAVLGNHDYERLFGNKVDIELAYGQSRETRWTMPARWYTFEFPKAKPVITFLCLDSNLPGTKGWNPLPWFFTMSAAEREQQNTWLREQLAKPRTAPFVAVVTHHPLYSNGVHNNNPLLIQQWGELFKTSKVDFMFSGHDHDLQHLEFEEHPTSFVISGGGGAELTNFTRPPKPPNQWGKKVLGFTDLELAPDGVIVRHIGLDAKQLYAFRKSTQGKVEVLA